MGTKVINLPDIADVNDDDYIVFESKTSGTGKITVSQLEDLIVVPLLMGTCSSASSDANKVITLTHSSDELITPCIIAVHFDNENKAYDPNLVVGDVTAPFVYRGISFDYDTAVEDGRILNTGEGIEDAYVSVPVHAWEAGQTVLAGYDGERFVWEDAPFVYGDSYVMTVEDTADVHYPNADNTVSGYHSAIICTRPDETQGFCANNIYGAVFSLIADTPNNTNARMVENTIVGGYMNSIIDSALQNAILGGQYNAITNSTSQNAILGGYTNSIMNSTGCNAILGGNTNSIMNSTGQNAILGGYTNSITNSTSQNAILGGQYNAITNSANQNAILGGNTNSIMNSAKQNAILGGVANSISYVQGGNGIFVGQNNEIVGSEGITPNCDQNAIIGGQNNVIRITNTSDHDENVIVGGLYNLIENASDMVVVGGKYNATTSGAYLVVGAGTSDTARKDAFVVTSSGVTTSSISANTVSLNDILLRDDDDTDIQDAYEVDVPDTEDVYDEPTDDSEPKLISTVELETTHKETQHAPHMTGTSLKQLLAQKDAQISELTTALVEAQAAITVLNDNIKVLADAAQIEVGGLVNPTPVDPGKVVE